MAQLWIRKKTPVFQKIHLCNACMVRLSLIWTYILHCILYMQEQLTRLEIKYSFEPDLNQRPMDISSQLSTVHRSTNWAIEGYYVKNRDIFFRFSLQFQLTLDNKLFLRLIFIVASIAMVLLKLSFLNFVVAPEAYNEDSYFFTSGIKQSRDQNHIQKYFSIW